MEGIGWGGGGGGEREIGRRWVGCWGSGGSELKGGREGGGDGFRLS